LKREDLVEILQCSNLRNLKLLGLKNNNATLPAHQDVKWSKQDHSEVNLRQRPRLQLLDLRKNKVTKLGETHVTMLQERLSGCLVLAWDNQFCKRAEESEEVIKLLSKCPLLIWRPTEEQRERSYL